jgi:RNA polymerase sigma-70 factor (sigma-E family)
VLFGLGIHVLLGKVDNHHHLADQTSRRTTRKTIGWFPPDSPLDACTTREQQGVNVDVGGFEEFVVARGAALLRTAYLLTADRHLAEDVVQEALSRVIGRWSRIAAAGDPEPYVRRVIYTVVVDRSRRRSSAERPTDEADRNAIAAPDQTDHVAAQVTLGAALTRLTVRQRQVLVLRYYEDLSESQTAEVMGCSPGTVKSQTAHALARLRLLSPELAVSFGRPTNETSEVGP